MTDINSVSLSGKVVRDGELKVQGTLAILNFDIAVNRSVKKDNEWKDEASFFKCTLFGKLAETIYAKVLKGKNVFLTGALKQDKWEARDSGEKRERTVIIVDKIRVL